MDDIGVQLYRPTKRSGTVSTVLKVCTTLHFLACANCQRSTSDIHGLGKSTLSQSIHNASSPIAKAKDYMKFQETPADLQIQTRK